MATKHKEKRHSAQRRDDKSISPKQKVLALPAPGNEARAQKKRDVRVSASKAKKNSEQVQ